MNFAQGMPNSTEPPGSNVFGQSYVPLPLGSNAVDANGAAWLQTTPAHMPWGITQPPVVRFTGEPLEMGHINYGYSHRSPPCMQFKRKIDPEPEAMPFTKLHITEEKMAAHMSQLQISSENSSREQFQYLAPEPMCAEELSKASTSKTDDENKLRRLFICDEIKRFKDENILPSAILCKLQKPSTALMLWQPPAGLLDAIKDNLGTSSAARMAAEEEDRRSQSREEDMSEPDNNNSTAIDLNTITSFGFNQSVRTASEDDMDL